MKKNGWYIVNRKDQRTGLKRPMKILYRNGQEIEHHWIKTDTDDFKSYTVTNNIKDGIGECELTKIDETYENLVKIFGKPTNGDKEKTDAEWIIKTNDGTVYTIYNYKNGKAYLGNKGKSIENIHNWHIGTNKHNDKSIQKINEIIKERKNQMYIFD